MSVSETTTLLQQNKSQLIRVGITRLLLLREKKILKRDVKGGQSSKSKSSVGSHKAGNGDAERGYNISS